MRAASFAAISRRRCFRQQDKGSACSGRAKGKTCELSEGEVIVLRGRRLAIQSLKSCAVLRFRKGGNDAGIIAAVELIA